MSVEHYFSTLDRIDLDGLNSELTKISLTAAHVQTYESSGILVVDGVFRERVISAALRACERLDQLVLDLDTSFADFNLEAQGGGWHARDEKTIAYRGQIRKFKNLIDHGIEFEQVALDPFLLRIVEALIGPGFRLHSKGFLMNKPLRFSTEKPWHQDSAYFPHANEILTAWIPLQDVNEENGCLFALPGSHKYGLLPHVGAEAQLDLQRLNLSGAQAYPMKRGAVLFMDRYTAHYSPPNTTPLQRRALIFRYEKTTPPHQRLTLPPRADHAGHSHAARSAPGIGREPRTHAKPDLALPDGQPNPGTHGQSDNVGQQTENILDGSSSRLGGGLSPDLRRGEEASRIEKRHLVINRVLREMAQSKGIEHLDMGTDYSYPFYHDFTPTREALESLKHHTADALHYPSSYGLKGLRHAFQEFLRRRFFIELDPDREIMINTGASQAFDALSRSFRGRYVLIPSLCLPTVSVIATGNGAQILRLPVDNANGLIDLVAAQRQVDELQDATIRFLYLNSPANPTGRVASLDYLRQVVDFAMRNGIVVVHDMDSWFTQHVAGTRLHNILEIEGSRDCCVSVFSLSKEFGLSGIRVGLIAGNRDVINAIRVHNSIFAVMIPEICQHAAEAALRSLDANDGKLKINEYVTHIMRKTVEGWKSLGWPAEQVQQPEGGFKYLVSVPPQIRPQGRHCAAELFDYYVASRAYVKLSTSRSFDPNNERFIRMIVMQNEKQVDEVFARLKAAGVNYGMDLPAGLDSEYAAFLTEHASSDF